MKKIIKYLLVSVLFLSTCACSKNPNYKLDDKVTLTLSDVLKVTNDEQNTIYYYYLLEIQNDTNETYDLSGLSYTITDDKEEDINAIDQNKFEPSKSVPASKSTYIAGYVGFPNNDQKNIGLYFNKDDEFLSFNNANVREASSTDVVSKQVGMAQTLYENDEIVIGYDYTQLVYDFIEGNTHMSGFMITYTNKTKKRVVVPYITPYATLNGMLIGDYSSTTNWVTATMETVKGLTFETPGLKDVSGETSGYALVYLDSEQSISCNIMTTFYNSFMCYNGGLDEPVSMELSCQALGIDRIVTLPKEIVQNSAETTDLEASGIIDQSKEQNKADEEAKKEKEKAEKEAEENKEENEE